MVLGAGTRAGICLCQRLELESVPELTRLSVLNDPRAEDGTTGAGVWAKAEKVVH